MLSSGNKRKGLHNFATSRSRVSKKVLQNPLYTFINKDSLVHHFSAKENKHLSALKNWATTLNFRMARLAESASLMLKGKGGLVSLPIAPGKIVIANATRIKHPSASVTWWHGVLRSSNDLVNLVFTKYGLSGFIKTKTNDYAIETFGHGLEAIIMINEHVKRPRIIDQTIAFKIQFCSFSYDKKLNPI